MRTLKLLFASVHTVATQFMLKFLVYNIFLYK